MSQHIKNSIPTGKTGWKVPIIVLLLLLICQAIAIKTPCDRQIHNATYGMHDVRDHEATTSLTLLSLNPSTLLIPALVTATIEKGGSLLLTQEQDTLATASSNKSNGSLQLTQGQDTFANDPSKTSIYSVPLSATVYVSREMSNATDGSSSPSTQWITSMSKENTDTTSGVNTLFSWATLTGTAPTPQISPTATGGDTTASQPAPSMSTKEKVVIGVGIFLFLVIMFITAVVYCGLNMRPGEVNWPTQGHELQAMAAT